MREEIAKAVEQLETDLSIKIQEVNKIKKMINQLYEFEGEPPIFNDMVDSTSIKRIRTDHFFGKSLSGAVKEYLKLKGNAAKAEEILIGLKSGGFEFPAEWKEKDYLKNLAISLSKNRYDFIYIKSAKAFGLPDFYPERKKEKLAKESKDEKNTNENTSEENIKNKDSDNLFEENEENSEAILNGSEVK